MEITIAKDVLSKRNGMATCKGVNYILVSRCALRNTKTGERVINGVAEDVAESDAGYFPMTLLHIADSWKRGGEAIACESNGEFDYIMREQKGYLTPHMTTNGARCHDE